MRQSHSWNENRVLKNKIIRDLRNEHVVLKLILIIANLNSWTTCKMDIDEERISEQEGPAL